jgi:hypothetical protein
VVSSSQTTFIQGRNILDRIVIFHEIVQELHRKKFNGVISTLDLEKVYGKVKWFFLYQNLRIKCFLRSGTL